MAEIKRVKRKHGGKQRFTSILVVCVMTGISFILSLACVSEGYCGTGPYFGTISLFSEAKISELRTLLKKSGDAKCVKLGKECPSIDELFNKFMGDIRNPNNPKLLVYIDKHRDVRTNMLLWRNRATPYLFEAQNIWVIIFSEEDMKVEAMLTTLFRANSLGKFSKRIIMPAEIAEKERKTRNTVKSINFRNLGHESVNNNLWLGIARFYLEPNTVSRVSVYPGKSQNTFVKNKTVTVHESGKVTVETEDRSEMGTAENEPQEKLAAPGFYLAEANFTNSGGSRFGLSAAIGATFNIDDNRKNDIYIGNNNVDLYVCAHWYMKRPILTKSVRGRSHTPSYSLVAGTNIDLLSEIIVGVSVGHIFGKNGLIIGANIMDPFKKNYEELQIRPFFAFDIRF